MRDDGMRRVSCFSFEESTGRERLLVTLSPNDPDHFGQSRPFREDMDYSARELIRSTNTHRCATFKYRKMYSEVAVPKFPLQFARYHNEIRERYSITRKRGVRTAPGHRGEKYKRQNVAKESEARVQRNIQRRRHHPIVQM